MSGTTAGDTPRLTQVGSDAGPGWRSSPLVVLALAYTLFLVLPGDIAFVGPLRSNGTPMRLLGMLALFMVVAGFIGFQHRRRARPVVWIVLVHLAFVLFAWTVAHVRELPPDQGAQIDRALLAVLAGTGLVLLAATVVTELRQAHRLILLLAVGSLVAALVGALQFVGVINVWADVIRAPFLTTITNPMGVTPRQGFSRVPGTMSSPLEFAVVLGVVLPLLLHLALHTASSAVRRVAWLAVLAVLVTLPFALARSGLLALVVALVVYLLFLRGTHRWSVVVAAVVTALAAPVVAPNITGAFRTLIVDAGEDDSIQGRLGDYPRVVAAFDASPWIGNGPSSDPERRFILDNQWLATLVRDGMVGVLGLAILLLGGAMLAAWAAGRMPAGSAGRSLNGALCAGLVALAVAGGTFDLLSFPQAFFAIFLLLALVGVGAHDDDAVPRARRSP